MHTGRHFNVTNFNLPPGCRTVTFDMTAGGTVKKQNYYCDKQRYPQYIHPLYSESGGGLLPLRLIAHPTGVMSGRLGELST